VITSWYFGSFQGILEVFRVFLSCKQGGEVGVIFSRPNLEKRLLIIYHPIIWRQYENQGFIILLDVTFHSTPNIF